MKATLRITPELLVALLHLPEDTKIYSAWVEKTGGVTDVVTLEVDHEDIKSGTVVAEYSQRLKKEVEFTGWVDA